MAPYFRFNVPCATTSTTTTTTTIAQYTVTLYGRNTTAGQVSVKVQYSTDGGSNWNDAGSLFDSATCSVVGAFTLASGSSASLRVTDGGNTYYFMRSVNSTTCPTYVSGSGACEATTGQPIGANRNIALTVEVLATCP